MADNITILDSAAAAKAIAADDIGSVWYQRTKVTWGPDGTANDADVASGKPLPVQIRGSAGADVVKLIDGALGATDPGILALRVRDDALTTLTEADGDYSPSRVDSIGAQWVTLAHMAQVIGSVDHGTADTQPPVKFGGVANAALFSAVDEGDRVNASFDLQGRLRIAGSQASGVVGVSERASTGTATEVRATVDDSTANGVQLIAANSSGTRRRVVITNLGTTVVYVHPGATGLTAGGTGDGRPLAGVVGAEQSWFTANELRATVDTGTQAVSIVEEVLA